MEKFYKYFILIALPIFVSCQGLYKSSWVETTDGQFGCPDGYECYAEIIPSSSASLKDEKYMNSEYVNINPDYSYDVIKFVLRKINDSDLVSSYYEENLYLQVPSNQEFVIDAENIVKNQLIIQKTSENSNLKEHELLKSGYLYVNLINDKYYVYVDINPSKDFKIKTVKVKLNKDENHKTLTYIN